MLCWRKIYISLDFNALHKIYRSVLILFPNFYFIIFFDINFVVQLLNFHHIKLYNFMRSIYLIVHFYLFTHFNKKKICIYLCNYLPILTFFVNFLLNYYVKYIFYKFYYEIFFEEVFSDFKICYKSAS